MKVEVKYMSISSIDTSQYTTPLASAMFNDVQAAVGARVYEEEKLPNVSATEENTPEVDLSRYYSNVQQPNLNSDVRSNLSQAAQQLDNAVLAAIEHGMSTQDAVKIQAAKSAYEANVNVAKSTFELEVS